MKHLRGFLLLICLIGISQSLSAQMPDGKPRFGIKAGVNGSNLYDDSKASDIKSRLGLTAGAFVQIPFAKNKFALRPEVLFTTKGAAWDFQSNLHSDIKINYVELPLSLEYHLLGIIDLHGGLQASWLASADGTTTGLIKDIKDGNVEKFDYGWHVGAGLDLGGLGLHLRVSRGLKEIGSESIKDTFGNLKNASWALTLSYGF